MDQNIVFKDKISLQMYGFFQSACGFSKFFGNIEDLTSNRGRVLGPFFSG